MKHILFFTPVLPCHTGHGSAIRAGIALQILSERHRVTVIQLDVWKSDATIMNNQLVSAHAVAHHLVPYPPTRESAQNLVTRHLSHSDVVGIYVFRLAPATFALQVISSLSKPSMPRALDLDDDECARTEKFIPLREAACEQAIADAERKRLLHLQGVQRLLLSRFDVCFLASTLERDALEIRYPDKRFELLPNVVRLPTISQSRRGDDATRDLLFLGSLSYLPNEDAILYFCASILPLLQASGEHVSMRVVGTQPPPSIQQWHGKSGVALVGPVKDVATEYARARVVVVPLRAGSGTRIKILEAFSYGVPVVSTSAGAEGLDVTHNIQLLIADTPEDFADCCRRLLDDATLVTRLTSNAKAWLQRHHTPDSVRGILHALFP